MVFRMYLENGKSHERIYGGGWKERTGKSWVEMSLSVMKSVSFGRRTETAAGNGPTTEGLIPVFLSLAALNILPLLSLSSLFPTFIHIHEFCIFLPSELSFERGNDRKIRTKNLEVFSRQGFVIILPFLTSVTILRTFFPLSFRHFHS